MTFYIKGIKEEKNKTNDQIDLEFLISTENEEKTRDFASKYGIIIVSLEEYLGYEKKFGNFYFEVSHGLNIYKITPKKENKSLQEIYKNYLLVGLDIISIKDYLDRLTELNVKEIMYTAKKELEEQRNLQKIDVEKQQEKDKQFFEDKTLDKLKDVIKRILPRCNEILAVLSQSGELSPRSLREIKDSGENIKKLSMGTNSEKIRESLDSLFSTIEKLEPDYYKILEKNGKRLSEDSIITNFDILKEDYKLQYARNKSKAGLSITSNNQYYLIFGRFGIFLNFLKKDLLNKAIDIDSVIKKIYDLIELSMLFIICEIAIYMIITYFIDENKITNILILLINSSIIGLSFSFLKVLSKKNKYLFYGIIPLCLIMFFVIKRFIISNFAL